MIASGEKKEEYREIKPYWIRRFLLPNFPNNSMESDIFSQEEFDWDVMNYEKGRWESHFELLSHFNHHVRDYDFVKFTNGYRPDSPSIIVELDKIIFSDGKEELGAEKGRRYFVLILGNVLDTREVK